MVVTIEINDNDNVWDRQIDDVDNVSYDENAKSTACICNFVLGSRIIWKSQSLCCGFVSFVWGKPVGMALYMGHNSKITNSDVKLQNSEMKMPKGQMIHHNFIQLFCALESLFAIF